MTDNHVEPADQNEDLWKSLRGKGHNLDIHVVDALGLVVMVDGVEMPFDDARALDKGWVTLDEIAKHYASPR